MTRRPLLPSMLLATLALAAIAACNSGGATHTIPAGYGTGDATYTLLYSTLGYESGATKRLLVRQNDTAAPVSEGLAFTWRLIDAGGRQAAAGRAAYAGRAWGIPLWQADFSDVTEPGRYRIMVEAPEVQLATAEFPIDRFLFFRTTFSALALDAAGARIAPDELDGGYFDSNTRRGRVAQHSDFLVGLIEVYQRRRNVLTEAQRRGLREAIDRASGYLLTVVDAGSGRSDAESNTRPYNNDDPANTAAALRGMARFAAAFQSDEPDKAQRMYRRARLSEAWLLANAPAAYPPALRAAVDYDLYKFSSDDKMLAAAAAAVRDEIAAYDLRTMDRRSDDTLPHFEAMHRMWRDLLSHPDRAAWEEAATKAAAQYREMIGRGAFQIVPPGTTSAERATSAQAQWDDVATAPPPGDGEDQAFGNGWIIARAIDALYLADITDDAELEKAATAGLAWVGGLNPGVPAQRASGVESPSPLAAASFAQGLGAVAALPWSRWEWPRPRPLASIVNGFRGGFTYDDSPQAGDTSLGLAGMWLYATSAYEDELNAGKRPPEAEAAPPVEAGVHVASVEPSEAGGLLQLTVSVANADGAPAAGVVVVGSWTGAPLLGRPVHEATLVNECVTAGSGACVLVLDATALPVSRPISVSVTNLEDRRAAYDLTADAGHSAEFR
ncbi:MAG: hypothetical protein HY874_09970 [Chloroflexi bacterium]|nr:hypothetical protein [Chloroflexota bacterium]